MSRQTKRAFFIAALGLESSSLQGHGWQSWLPLVAGLALILYVSVFAGNTEL